jgi:hypothetical protein
MKTRKTAKRSSRRGEIRDLTSSGRRSTRLRGGWIFCNPAAAVAPCNRTVSLIGLSASR